MWSDYKSPSRPTNLTVAAYSLTLVGFIAVSISHYKERWIFAGVLSTILVIITVIAMVLLFIVYRKKPNVKG